MTTIKVMRAAAASIQVLRPGGHWRIAVPDAYFPKYLFCFCFLIGNFFWSLADCCPLCLFSKVSSTIIVVVDNFFYIKVIITAFTHSEWYQQYARPGGKLLATQPHMVMWSVDTLPPLFEVITLSLFSSSSQPQHL